MRHVCRLAFGCLALLAFCLSAPAARAQDEPFAAAEIVPASIHYVAAGGFWTRANEEGFFRAVVTAGGVEHVVHRLFLQWLRTDAKTQSYALVRTVNVKELNLGHGHVLTVKTAFGNINAFKIDVTAKSRGGKTRRFAIVAKGDGTYTIRPR